MYVPRLRLRILEEVFRKEPHDIDDHFRARFSVLRNPTNTNLTFSTGDWEKGESPTCVVLPLVATAVNK
jgi:hypothetical protein